MKYTNLVMGLPDISVVSMHLRSGGILVVDIQVTEVKCSCTASFMLLI